MSEPDGLHSHAVTVHFLPRGVETLPSYRPTDKKRSRLMISHGYPLRSMKVCLTTTYLLYSSIAGQQCVGHHQAPQQGIQPDLHATAPGYRVDKMWLTEDNPFHSEIISTLLYPCAYPQYEIGRA